MSAPIDMRPVLSAGGGVGGMSLVTVLVETLFTWDRRATPEIPTKRNRNLQHCVDNPDYALRSHVEHLVDHLK